MERNYNKSQLEAIRHGEGPCLTLAGPGSGKTAVITERVKNLITEHGVKPTNILVITFTKAAATEMKERFYKLMGQVDGVEAGFGKYPVTFGTFHAVFFQILKYFRHYCGKKFKFLRLFLHKSLYFQEMCGMIWIIQYF